jgi:ketosteroid isomerase-like protein
VSQENVDLVTGGYDDFNSGDIDGLLVRFHPEIEWIEPGGGNAPSGTFRGPDSVANDVFARVPENFDEFSCTVEEARDEGDTVVVTARSRGRTTAAPSWMPRRSRSMRSATARWRGSRTRSTRRPGPKVGAEPGAATPRRPPAAPSAGA